MHTHTHKHRMHLITFIRGKIEMFHASRPFQEKADERNTNVTVILAIKKSQ